MFVYEKSNANVPTAPLRADISVSHHVGELLCRVVAWTVMEPVCGVDAQSLLDETIPALTVGTEFI